MKVAVENETIKVNSPYNKSFVAGAKQIQGKWNAPCWVFPEENKEAVKALLIECYGECGELGAVSTVTVDLTSTLMLRVTRTEKSELAQSLF